MKSELWDYISPLNLHGKALLELEDRFEEMENKVFKNDRQKASLSQQILLLKYTGLIDNFKTLFKKQKDLVNFLSYLLKADKDNIKKDLAVIDLKESHLEIARNYEFLVVVFNELGLNSLRIKCQNRLDQLLKKG